MVDIVEYETELGLFTITCLRARESNKRVCEKHGIQFEGNMTPQEEKYLKYYNSHKVSFAAMTVLERRAHREELSDIAMNARAGLSAITDIDNADKKTHTGVTGFSRNVNIDETSSDAINAIKDRQKRLSKKDKILSTLTDMGIPQEEAERMLSARNIRDTVSINKPITKPITKPIELLAAVNMEAKIAVNPFAKK